jgi:hypothetical protein
MNEMALLNQIFVTLSGMVAGVSGDFFSVSGDFFSDFLTAFPWGGLWFGGEGVLLVFALGTLTRSDIPEEVLSNIRQWHGSIDKKFDNINNLTEMLTAHRTDWNVSQSLLKQLTDSRNELATLIVKCRSNTGSPADRMLRNSLLRSTVGLCLTLIKSWAHTQCYSGVITANDVHLLGFFLPGDNSGRRSRLQATNVLVDVKVSVVNMNHIRVIIDQAGTKNAALTRHGWPHGIRQALIVILAADGVTEVHRQLTTRLHTHIEMPPGSHGKQFILKAAFLRHVDDRPVFGPEPTFSMPLTTEDLAATAARRRHEIFEKPLHDADRHHQ